MYKKIIILFLAVIVARQSFAQYPQFSLATDVAVQRSFKKEQRFWAAGHTTIANFHITPKDGVYIWLAYFSDGKFSNQVTADAKLPSTLPQKIGYENKARLRFKHLSIGWKKYLKGNPDNETGYNLYSYAGLGLMMGRVNNIHSTAIDTAVYNVPVLSGRASFKRLTLDLGLGAEIPVGGDLYIYGEVKALVPTTDYPSRFIFINDNAPFVSMLGLGVRLLF